MVVVHITAENPAVPTLGQGDVERIISFQQLSHIILLGAAGWRGREI